MEMSRDWVVVGGAYPMPQIDDPTEREAEMMALWRRWVKEESSREPDYEDWVEQVTRLSAAIEAIGIEHVYLTHDNATARRLHDDAVVDLHDLLDLPHYGSRSTVCRLRTERSAPLASRYDHLDAFVRNAGRPVRTVTHDSEAPDGSDLYRAVLDLARSGTERAVVKIMAKSKYENNAVLTLTPDITEKEVERLLAQHFDWAMIHLDTIPGAFLVQEWTLMEYEYRLFVVSGKVVSGAGCIEEFTPVLNTTTFDPRVRRNRRQRSTVVTRPEVVEALVAFGRTVADEISAEQPDLRNYTLDVAMGESGPLVIELNDLSNSGLYANDVWAIAAAVVAGPPSYLPAAEPGLRIC